MAADIYGAAFVLCQTTTSGTGAYTLGAALPGFFAPGSAGTGIVSGRRYRYRVADALTTVPSQTEDGPGTLTLSDGVWTITREAPRQISGTMGPVNWPAGATRYIHLYDDPVDVRDFANATLIRQGTDVPLDWSNLSGVAFTASTDFGGATIPASTRRLRLSGWFRLAATGGSAARACFITAAVRNAADTADETDLGTVGAVNFEAPGRQASVPLSSHYLLPAALAASRPFRLRAASNTGESVTAYQLEANIACEREV